MEVVANDGHGRDFFFEPRELPRAGEHLGFKYKMKNALGCYYAYIVPEVRGNCGKCWKLRFWQQNAGFWPEWRREPRTKRRAAGDKD